VRYSTNSRYFLGSKAKLTHTFDAERLGRVVVGITPRILFVYWLTLGSAEHRMIENLVLDTELAKPEKGNVDL